MISQTAVTLWEFNPNDRVEVKSMKKFLDKGLAIKKFMPLVVII